MAYSSASTAVPAQASSVKPSKHEDGFCVIPTTSRKHKQNVFGNMRPQAGIYADYDISQTDIKMDAGPTKLHLERTVAEYIPPPPGVDVTTLTSKKRKIKRFHGGPPVWEFLDEKRKKKIDKLQEFYKQRLEELIERNKKIDGKKRLSIHNYLLRLAGPEWYQELSPRQINCVNELKDCIVRDLQTQTTINCYENLAYLGLVPRPKPTHIQAALQICCACPVDFLLILYQLINPKRKSYSINDRIILSAVVHLTMTETLRELHIRIPSPPPLPAPSKPAKKVKKKAKKKTYKSPYLIPFTFKPDPPKHTGVYKDNHRQYPESPYFSYISELKRQIEYDEDDGCSTSLEYGGVDYENKETAVGEANIEFERADDSLNSSLEVNVSDDSIVKAERDIAKELVVAQKEYNKLTTQFPVPRLHKPSVYIPCKQAKMIKKLEEVELEEEPPSQHDIDVAVEVKLATKYDEASGKAVKKICECTVKFKDKRLSQKPKIVEDIMLVRDRGDAANMQDKASEAIDLPELPEIDAGKNVTVTKTSSSPCKCKYLMRKQLRTQSCNCEECRQLNKQLPPFIISGLKQTDEGGDTVPVIQGVKDEACDCMTNYERKIMRYEEYKARHDLVENMSALSQKFIVGGVCMGPQGKPVFTILGVKPECRCLKLKEEEAPTSNPLIELKEISSSRCTCKPKTEGTIDTAVCRCERCLEMARSRYKHDAIIAGYRAAENEEPVKIIAGIKTHKTECECLRKYRKAVEKYESWKRRNRAVEELKTAVPKFAIGGVVNRPNQPPVFIISGVEPQRESPSIQRLREEEAERERLKRMPKKLLGLQYLISGVKETPDGNVFIISGVKGGGQKCKCLQLYDAFMRQHKKCFKISEIYDEKIKEDLYELDKCWSSEGELKIDKSWEPEIDTSWEPEDDKYWELENEIGGERERAFSLACKEEVEETTPERRPSQPGSDKCWEPDDQQLPASNKVDSGAKSEAAPVQGQSLATSPPEKPKMDTSPPEKPKMDNNLMIKLEYKKDKPEEVCVCCQPKEGKVEEEVELKRIIILDKFPENRKTQYTILKKALASMAEDGYPLAKLPDCYKLPHFKLWLYLRSGKSWSLQDKEDYIRKYNKPCWDHTNICFKEVNPTKLIGIDQKNFRQFSYANVKSVKKLVEKQRGHFYRVLRQNAIEDAKEFIPTMNLYEFPFPTFRDCLFAYIPGKEEEVFSFRPWPPHEFKNMCLNRS